MIDPNTEQSATTDAHLSQAVAEHLDATGQEYLSPRHLDVVRDGVNVIVRDRAPDNTYSNAVVLAYEVLKAAGLPMALRMERRADGKPYVECEPYTQVQRAAKRHVELLDTALETTADDTRKALERGVTFALTLHGAEAYTDAAERSMWRELERTGDLPDVLGRALQAIYRDSDTGSTNAMHVAAAACARQGYAKFIRSACQLALQDNLLPVTLVNRLFTL